MKVVMCGNYFYPNEETARKKLLDKLNEVRNQYLGDNKFFSNVGEIQEKITHNGNTTQHIFYFWSDCSFLASKRRKRSYSYTVKEIG
jgi:hypothetical protein